MSISMSNVERAADSFSETLTIDEESAIPRLTAPPFTEFRGSPDDLMNYLQSFAKARRYSLRKKSTKQHCPPRIGVEVGVMIIGCSKGGKVQAPTGSKRKRPFKTTECLFRLTARENRGIWSLKLSCGDHNHVGLNATAHVPHRQMAMTAEKVERIQNTTKCGIRPRQILNEFRSQSKIQGSECILKLKDIYNPKTVLRATELKNNTPTQALALVLRERQSWFHILEKNLVTSSLTRLFLAMFPLPESFWQTISRSLRWTVPIKRIGIRCHFQHCGTNMPGHKFQHWFLFPLW
ncbi:hypothetical protein K3495_g13577 [Podosphaera aphanis]|nr:hypothetical protein K3495_g13577 [Podosphaera aphanis]